MHGSLDRATRILHIISNLHNIKNEWGAGLALFCTATLRNPPGPNGELPIFQKNMLRNLGDYTLIFDELEECKEDLHLVYDNGPVITDNIDEWLTHLVEVPINTGPRAEHFLNPSNVSKVVYTALMKSIAANNKSISLSNTRADMSSIMSTTQVSTPTLGVTGG